MEKKLIDPQKLVTQARYADRQGISTTRVGQLVQSGKLPSVQVDGGLLLYDPPEKYEAAPTGRPPKEK